MYSLYGKCITYSMIYFETEKQKLLMNFCGTFHFFIFILQVAGSYKKSRDGMLFVQS